MRKAKTEKREKLKIPLEFDKAVSAFLTIKPEPKKSTKPKVGAKELRRK